MMMMRLGLLSVLFMGCEGPPEERVTVAHVTTHGYAPEDPVVAPPAPAQCDPVGTWAITWAYGEGTCDDDAFGIAIGTLDGPSYPSRCFTMAINPINLFGATTTMTVERADSGYTTEGRPLTVSADGCTISVDLSFGPTQDACGEWLTTSRNLTIAVNSSGLTGAGEIGLLVEDSGSYALFTEPPEPVNPTLVAECAQLVTFTGVR